MRYRQFGNTDLQVSEIGFGAWAIGGGSMIGHTAIGWGDADDQDSIKAIQRSLAAGVNFFDTADIYGLGHSEQLLGDSLSGKQDVIIATKCGNVSRDGRFTSDYSKSHLLHACEESLLRLKRDYIDYYQLHTPRMAHLLNGECVEAMELLKRQGKIRYWGVSLNTFDPLPEAEYLVRNQLGSGFQLVLNMINQRSLPLLKNPAVSNYGIIARMPLQFGLLTGKFGKQAAFPENDHRRKRLTPEVIDAAGDMLEPVWDLCNKYRVNKAQLALSYVLSYDQVSTVIPGLRNEKQVDENTSGLVNLDVEEREFIEKLGFEKFASLMDLIESLG